jgi:HEAT repeat protein
MSNFLKAQTMRGILLFFFGVGLCSFYVRSTFSHPPSTLSREENSQLIQDIEQKASNGDVQGLLQLLNNQQLPDRRRMSVIRHLGRLGDENTAAVLAEKKAGLHRYHLSILGPFIDVALARIQTRNLSRSQQIDRLLQLLDDVDGKPQHTPNDENLQCNVVVALGELGAFNELKALDSRLIHPSRKDTYHALYSGFPAFHYAFLRLKTEGMAIEKRVPTLINLMKAHPENIRQAQGIAVLLIELDKPAVPFLIAALGEFSLSALSQPPDVFTAESTLAIHLTYALQGIGDVRALPALERLTNAEDVSIRDGAHFAIESIQQNRKTGFRYSAFYY